MSSKVRAKVISLISSENKKSLFHDPIIVIGVPLTLSEFIFSYQGFILLLWYIVVSMGISACTIDILFLRVDSPFRKRGDRV